MHSTLRLPRFAWLLLLLALTFRLLFVLVIDPSPDMTGGDANWYMRNGYDLIQFGKTLGPLQTAPLYLVFVGVVQAVVPGAPSAGYAYTHAELQTVRIIQAFLGAGVCLFVYVLARRLFGERVARLATVLLAISPTLIIEAGNLTTEGLFLFFVFGGLALVAEASTHTDNTDRLILAAGVLFGLATLTRAVFLLFPLIIVAHLFLTHRARWPRLILMLLIPYALLVSTWTVYNLAVWDRFVVGGEGLFSFLYQGAEGKGTPQEIDQQLGMGASDSHEDRQEVLREETVESISADPVNWALHRVKELAKALLQPHNTTYFDGPSIKDTLSRDHSPGGLRDLTQIEAFWPKLALYLFHFAGLGLGALGMLLSARRWRDLLPLYGTAIYFIGIHLVLLALPRYLLPIYPVFWIFGAAALLQLAPSPEKGM